MVQLDRPRRGRPPSARRRSPSDRASRRARRGRRAAPGTASARARRRSPGRARSTSSLTRRAACRAAASGDAVRGEAGDRTDRASRARPLRTRRERAGTNSRGRDAPVGAASARADAPQAHARLGVLAELRCDARDLPQRRPAAGRTRCTSPAPPRRLRRHGRASARAARRGSRRRQSCEQPRPEVVVLALEKRRVVAQPVLVEHLAVDEHGRMEERAS